MTKAPLSLQDLQRRIEAKAKAEPSWRFWGLYVHVCKRETLRAAYQVAKANNGAPGIDGVTFEDIEASGVEPFLAQIRDALVARTYQPMRVRRKAIPKDGGTKVRVLGIPMGHAYCISLQRRLGIAVVAPTSMNAIDQLTQYNELGAADQVSSGKNRSESIRITSNRSGLLTSTPTACFSVNDGLVGQTLMAVQSCHARRRYSWPFTS
jgi:hypothetical protein